jgi:hypothetical protein
MIMNFDIVNLKKESVKSFGQKFHVFEYLQEIFDDKLWEYYSLGVKINFGEAFKGFS